MQALVGLFELPEAEDGPEDAHFVDVDESQGYQAAFSQLLFAPVPKYDPLKGTGNTTHSKVREIRPTQRYGKHDPLKGTGNTTHSKVREIRPTQRYGKYDPLKGTGSAWPISFLVRR